MRSPFSRLTGTWKSRKMSKRNIDEIANRIWGNYIISLLKIVPHGLRWLRSLSKKYQIALHSTVNSPLSRLILQHGTGEKCATETTTNKVWGSVRSLHKILHHDLCSTYYYEDPPTLPLCKLNAVAFSLSNSYSWLTREWFLYVHYYQKITSATHCLLTQIFIAQHPFALIIFCLNVNSCALVPCPAEKVKQFPILCTVVRILHLINF